MIELPKRDLGSLTVVLADSGEGKSLTVDSIYQNNERRFLPFGSLLNKIPIYNSHFSTLPPIAQRKDLLASISEAEFLACNKCGTEVEKESIYRLISNIINNYTGDLSVSSIFPLDFKSQALEIAAQRGQPELTEVGDLVHLTVDRFNLTHNKQRLLDAVQESQSLTNYGTCFTSQIKKFGYTTENYCPNCGALNSLYLPTLNLTISEAMQKIPLLKRLERIGLGAMEVKELIQGADQTISTLSSLPLNINRSLIVVDNAFEKVPQDLIPVLLDEYRTIAKENNLVLLFTSRDCVAKFTNPEEIFVVGDAPELEEESFNDKIGAQSIEVAEKYKIQKTTLSDYFSITKELAALFISLPEAKIKGLSVKSFLENYRQISDVKFKGFEFKDLYGQKLSDSCETLKNIPKISKPLKVLCDSGLSYLTLDRKLTSLSSGEWRRVAILRELLSLPKNSPEVTIPGATRHLRQKTAKLFTNVLRSFSVVRL